MLVNQSERIGLPVDGGLLTVVDVAFVAFQFPGGLMTVRVYENKTRKYWDFQFPGGLTSVPHRLNIQRSRHSFNSLED